MVADGSRDITDIDAYLNEEKYENPQTIKKTGRKKKSEMQSNVKDMSLQECSKIKTIAKRFARRQMKMPEVNKKQAYIIEDSIVLDNKEGTAPGLWVEEGSKTMILLPGPPHEIKSMFENSVWPLLQGFQKKYIYHRVIKTAGLTESKIETLLVGLYPKMHQINA